MTTFDPFFAVDMNVPGADDKMEMGASPFPHVEDIDFDLEPVREPSMDRSMVDDAETMDRSLDATGSAQDYFGRDDDMIEDEMQNNQLSVGGADMGMEAFNPPDASASVQDEEILYDYEATGSLDMTNATGEELEQLEGESFEETQMMSEQIADQDEEAYDDDRQHDSVAEHESKDGTNEDPIDDDDNQTADALTEDVQDNTAEDMPVETEVVDFALEEAAIEYVEAGSANENKIEAGTSASSVMIKEQSAADDPNHANHDLQFESSHSAEQDQAQLSAEHGPALAGNGTGQTSASDQTTLLQETTGPIHSVTVSYLGQDMSLFPPMVGDSSATFFLQDPTLAYESLEKLLASCREILGDSLEHDDELVLDIPALGLHICEDSKYASQLSLSQVMDVFLSLSHNENLNDPEPMYCHLSSRVCLASQYAYLASSAQEGKTYTEITAENLDSPDFDEPAYQDPSADPETNDTGFETAHNTSTNEEEGVNFDDDVDVNAVSEVKLAPGKGDFANDAPGAASDAPSAAPNDEAGQVPATQEDPAVELPQSTNTSEDIRSHGELQEYPNPESEDRNERVFTDQARTNDADDEIQEADVDEQSDEVTVQHENVSNSSHTIDNRSPAPLDADDFVGDGAGDNNDVDQQNPPQESEGIEADNLQDEVSRDVDDTAEDGSFQALDDDGFDDLADIEDVTDLLDQEFDEHEAFDANNAAAQDEVTTEETNKETDAPYKSKENLSQIVNGSGSLDVDSASTGVPVTPSKQSSSTKRKAMEEEEDLDFLDLSTPEPKRTRAS